MAARQGANNLLALACALALASCDSADRHVITEKAPFSQVKLPHEEARNDAVAEAVKIFAQQHQMDFLNPTSLPAGDINVTAAGPRLNLKAIHSAELDRGVLMIWAYARDAPTPQDRKLADEFDARIRAAEGNAG
jgi:hypothetical protein